MELAWLGHAIVVAYVVVLTCLCIYGAHRYFLVWLFYRVRDRRPTPAGRLDPLPVVTVQLPMYNEKRVARRVIEAAARLDYPRDKLQIQVLDDSTDETVEIVRETVERLKAQGLDIEHIHRSDRTGYKAGALAHGMRSARGEFIAIFDADFLPPPEILRNTIHYFADPQVGMVQCRWDHLNRHRSLLTEAQAILLDGHFFIEHTARNRTGRFMSFNGTAGIWRRATIEDAGGWQHDTLTEDLDLSYRAQLRGWKFVFLPELTAPAELPPEMVAFKAQQHRWTKGGAQTCRKLLPVVFSQVGDWRIKLEAFFHLTSCCVYVLMLLLSLLLGPALVFKLLVEPIDSPFKTAWDSLLFFVGTGSALSFYIVSQRQLPRRWSEILRQLPGLMAIGVGIALNNAIAAIEGFFRPAGEFVRTPKYGDRDSDRRKRRRTARGDRRTLLTAWGELAIGLYLLACLLTLFFFDHWFQRVSAALPFMGLFIFGYLYVALTTFAACRPARSRAALRPVPRGRGRHALRPALGRRA